MDLTIYVGSAYDSNMCGFGIIFLENEQEIARNSGFREDRENLCNVGGILYGCTAAIYGARKLGAGQVTICLRHEGVIKWANGEWKASTPITQHFQQFVAGMRQNMQIKFRKLPKDGNDPWDAQTSAMADAEIDKGMEHNGWSRF